MKSVKFSSILGVFILLTAVISSNSWAASKLKDQIMIQKPAEYKCFLTLNSISKTSGLPGTTFEMMGVFGAEQGLKMPAINKDGMEHALFVLFWSNTKLVVKVPIGLAPGIYKTGVYCSDPCKPGGITTYDMVWRDFKVLELIHKPAVIEKNK